MWTRTTPPAGTATRHGRQQRYHPAQPDALAWFWALQQPWPGASAIASFLATCACLRRLDGSVHGKARGSGRCGSFAYSCAALQLHLDSSATDCSCAYSCAARCATGAATRPTCKLEQCARCLDSSTAGPDAASTERTCASPGRGNGPRATEQTDRGYGVEMRASWRPCPGRRSELPPV